MSHLYDDVCMPDGRQKAATEMKKQLFELGG